MTFYVVGDVSVFDTAQEAIARVMELIEQAGDLDALARANADRRRVHAVLSEGMDVELGGIRIRVVT